MMNLTTNREFFVERADSWKFCPCCCCDGEVLSVALSQARRSCTISHEPVRNVCCSSLLLEDVRAEGRQRRNIKFPALCLSRDHSLGCDSATHQAFLMPPCRLGFMAPDHRSLSSPSDPKQVGRARHFAGRECSLYIVWFFSFGGGFALSFVIH